MDRAIKWFAAALLSTVPAHAQTSRGTVSGTVLDPVGAVVVGAAVALTNNGTNVRRTAETNEAGIYRFDAVDPGGYEFKVTQTGFHPFLASGLGVEANRTTMMNVKLELGSEATSVQVSAEAQVLIIRDGPLRGGNFLPREVTQLPLVDSNPFSLVRTLPGVIRPSGSAYTAEGGGEGVEFSVNGQRVRGNNFLLDGTDNNDITWTGIAQPFNMPDAVQEVAAQTSNFSVEFGRAAGGVLNVITKSGTNNLHGTASWRYQSQRFTSVSNLAKLNDTPKSVFVHNVPGFTLGGPVRKNRTFFFAGFQQDTNRSTTNFPLVVPMASAVDRLRTLFPSNPRVDLYLSTLGELRGTANPISLALGADPQTGVNRGSVQFATAPLSLPATNEGPEWIVRLDHYQSEAHRLSARYIYGSRLSSPGTVGSLASVYFPGFYISYGDQNQNVQITDSYTFGPTYTNELRFSYARLDFDQVRISSQSVPLASTLPGLTITSISAPGITQNPQFHNADNFLFQETQTRLTGRHTFRYGVEMLRQLATQQPNAYPLGQIDYKNSSGYSALANYIDDFSGASGRIRKTLNTSTFYPNVFRQSYFFEDFWRTMPSLTLTLGLRYEHPGSVANALRYPAFTGFDPDLFFKPNQVNPDKKNFGPALGLAWSPSFSSGVLSKIFGDHKLVWRGGYQISYQALYTQALSLDLAASTPNAIMIDQTSAAAGRGDANWSLQLPASTARPPSLLDTQYGTLERNFRNPYTERFSFGFQRQLPGQSLLDVSYVGAESHHLTTRADLNPVQPSGATLHPDFGRRTVRTSQGNSAYHSLQARLDRRFAHGFQATASYTLSKSLDSTSEGIAQVEAQYFNANLTSVPAAQGGLKLDRGPSDFDRGQRLALSYFWEVPGPKKGFWRNALVGWSAAGVYIFQSGTPYTVVNGFDRNGDAWLADRPDITNPAAPLNSRAVLATACATGYRNPDTNSCVNPGDVHWVEGTGFPNASTVGRNTVFTNGTNNFDLSLFKSFAFHERNRLEFRWEAQNALNHPQFVNVPQRDVFNTLPGRFLNRDFTDSGIRSMWVQVKLIF